MAKLMRGFIGASLLFGYAIAVCSTVDHPPQKRMGEPTQIVAYHSYHSFDLGYFPECYVDNSCFASVALQHKANPVPARVIGSVCFRGMPELNCNSPPKRYV